MKRVGKGFTLIELLVVIAIIAILAAILFPVFISAKNQAKMANCQSNMKQAAGALTMYANDWSGVLPLTQCQQPKILTATTGRTLWGMAIKKYIASKPHLLYCAQSPAVFVDSQMASEMYRYYHSTTIGMNAALGVMVTEVGVWLPPTSLSGPRAPSRTIMLADSSSYAYAKEWNTYYGPSAEKCGCWIICPGTKSQPVLGSIKYINPTTNWLMYDFFDPRRHDGRVNVACVDGHVVTKDRQWLLEPHATDANSSDFTWWDKL